MKISKNPPEKIKSQSPHPKNNIFFNFSQVIKELSKHGICAILFNFFLNLFFVIFCFGKIFHFFLLAKIFFFNFYFINYCQNFFELCYQKKPIHVFFIINNNNFLIIIYLSIKFIWRRLKITESETRRTKKKEVKINCFIECQ